MGVKKKNKSIFGITAFFIVGMIFSIFFFEGSAGAIAFKYLYYLLYIVIILSVVFYIVKFLFASQASKGEPEFKLTDIPKNQENIRKN